MATNRRSFPLRLCGIAVAALILAPALWGTGACTEEPARYGDNNYRVRKIRFTSALDFIQAAKKMIEQSKSSLHFKEGDAFSAELYSEGVENVTAHVKSELGETSRFRISFVSGSLEACDDSSDPRELDVVYHVFFFNFPKFAAPLLENRRNELTQPVVAASQNVLDTNVGSSTSLRPTAAATIAAAPPPSAQAPQPAPGVASEEVTVTDATPTAASSAKVQPTYVTTPTFGYNAGRGAFGGMSGTIPAGGSIFDNIAYSVTGGGTGTSGLASLQGSRDPGYQLLNHDTYAVQYSHINSPSTLTSLRQSLLTARFIGQSKPQANGITLRYAAELEGGNQQTNLKLAPSTGDLTSARGGDLKFAAGFTQRGKVQSAAISAGLALGSTKAGVRLDYVKTVIDADWNRTLQWPWLAKKNNRHYPLFVETHGGFGQIWQPGRGVPVVDRFFGGNTVADFLDDPSWQVNDGPYIRSIPQGRLAGLGVGGDRFSSLNTTVAPTLKAWPLVPWSVLNMKGFDDNKQLAINAGKKIDQLSYEAKQQASKDAASALKSMDGHLKDLQAIVATVTEKLTGAAQTDAFDAERFAGRAERAASTAIDNPAALAAVPGNVSTCLTHLQTLIGSLAVIPTEAGDRDRLIQLHSQIQDESKQLSENLKKIDHVSAQAAAEKDFTVVEPALNSFLYEMNRVAFSPVAIFDVAHLVPDRVGERYAVGGGIRVTVFVVNVTMGYAWNGHPDPQLQIGGGAAFFSFQITDFFR